MNKYLIAREIFYTVGQRRFRTLLNRCDGCYEEFSEECLKKIAEMVGENAEYDNIVFSCATCLSLKADSVTTLSQVIFESSPS